MNIIILAALFMFMVSNSSWHMGVLIVVGIIVVFAVSLILRQESMLYVPCVMAGMQTTSDNPEGYRSPSEKKWNLEFEDVYIKTSDDIMIHAWFIKAGKDKTKTAPTYLFCHANAGNIGLRLPNFAKLVERLEANILAFDYRGYGASEGHPFEEGIIEDALAAWRWLDEAAKAGTIDGKRVFVFGRSLGGAVALALSHELHKQGSALPCGLILENTFASIPMLVNSLFPFLAFEWLKDKFLRLRWLSIDRIPHLEIPLLFISGQQDEVVPCSHSEILHNAAVRSPLRRILRVEDGMHNDTWDKGGENYWKSQDTFIKECSQLRLSGSQSATSCSTSKDINVE